MTSNKNTLRPVLVNVNGKQFKGYFHRFVYSCSNHYSVTQALVELADGRLRFYDPFYVQFSDREVVSNKTAQAQPEK